MGCNERNTLVGNVHIGFFLSKHSRRNALFLNMNFELKAKNATDFVCEIMFQIPEGIHLHYCTLFECQKVLRRDTQ